MAEIKKRPKKTTPQQVDSVSPTTVDRKRQLRLSFGIIFLLTGIFICFAITSYFFTWKLDYDKVATSNGLLNFLLHSHEQVANWGGRFGAVISHALVSRVGIISIAFGIFFGSLGTHLIYGKRVLPLLRYLRWLSLLLLIVAPVLTFILPNNNDGLKYGGDWGNLAIEYLNGFVGITGTGLILFAIACFFVFVIFALDIRPFLQRMKHRAKSVAAAMVPETIITNTSEEKEVSPLLVIDDAANAKDWNMSVSENGPKKTINDLFASENNNTDLVPDPTAPIVPKNNITQEEEETEEELEEETEAYDDEQAEEIAFPDPVKEKKKPVSTSDLSFEVIKQEDEQPAIKHGAHISIASKELYAPELDLPDYKFPTLDLLENRAPETISLNKEELERNKDQIIKTLGSFGIEIQHISATVGPTVTLYEIVPAEGVRISKIRNLEDDIALSLAALGIRIIAPIPGKGTIGIEVPNANKQIVSMRALLSSDKFVNNKMSLPIALGKKIDNENYIVDLATMPHLLMAGATGQGKSVGINAILVSLLYKKHPSQLKFVMVDPKKVELSIYRTIEKHFLAKLPNETEAIITDIKKVIYTLRALCDEMDDRYGLLKDAGARNIKEYNEKFISRKLNPENGHKYLPFIVLVIDEFADLIMTAGKEVEMPIARLAQLARAVGIHLIIATQRPSVNVITGTIKANFPARIAFKVSAKVDSRTILDTGGAEQLVGRGDMLISHGSELLRLQCAFVDTPEVENVVEFIGKQRGYPQAHPLPEPEMDDEDMDNKSFDAKNRDKLFEDCAKQVVQSQSGSTSMLQRRFNLGYNRAGRIMDQLEAAGIVGPAMGSKPRDVLFKSESELAEFLNGLD